MDHAPTAPTRAYWATDNLVDPAWKGVPPRSVIDEVAAAGLQLDPATGTGVVLHMLSCLAIDGRLGLTAIGTLTRARRRALRSRRRRHRRGRPPTLTSQTTRPRQDSNLRRTV